MMQTAFNGSLCAEKDGTIGNLKATRCTISSQVWIQCYYYGINLYAEHTLSVLYFRHL